MLKVIVTTSDRYHHLLPIFFKLYVREWNWPCELVGYEKPKMELPECCTWVSLGEQRGPKYFSDDLRPYFEKQDRYFIWLMEDTFIKNVKTENIKAHSAIIKLPDSPDKPIGKFCLTREGMNRPHQVWEGGEMWVADPKSTYRLSTQPSIWNRDFLLQYLKPGLDPWSFEKQDTNDHWQIIGPTESIIFHNEGVRKNDIHKLNLEGISL